MRKIDTPDNDYSQTFKLPRGVLIYKIDVLGVAIGHQLHSYLAAREGLMDTSRMLISKKAAW